jgi:hypothetical protein
MKTKSQKRRERRIALSKIPEIDGDAYRQGTKLDRMQHIGPVQQSRLNKTYTVDGFVFNTGKKHRHIG